MLVWTHGQLSVMINSGYLGRRGTVGREAASAPRPRIITNQLMLWPAVMYTDILHSTEFSPAWETKQLSLVYSRDTEGLPKSL